MGAKKKNFEESLRRLEEIVNIMENSDADLDSTVKLYKEGVDLSLFCADKLKAAEQEISVLRKKAEGVFEKQPFDVKEDI